MATLNAFLGDVETFLDKLASKSADALHDAADALGGLSDWVRSLAAQSNIAGQPVATPTHFVDPTRVADLRERLDEAKDDAAQPAGAAALPLGGVGLRLVIEILSAVLDRLSAGPPPPPPPP